MTNIERVYFGRAGGRIKIGTTSQPVARRLAQISASLPEPLILIGSIDGDRHIERAVHRKLVEYKLSGEWFQDCPESSAAIGAIIDNPAEIIELAQKKKGAAKPFVPEPVSPERRASARRLMLETIWPGEWLEQLAALTGAPRDQVRLWIDGKERMPDILRFALTGLFFLAGYDDPIPSFLKPKSAAAA